MSGVIDVISRKVGVDDIAFGVNSFVYVDINGTARRINQVNAASVPWYSIPNVNIEALVNSSYNLPVGASNLGVVNTATFSGPIVGSGTVSGLVFNNAAGQLLYGQLVPAGAIPTGIPAVNIGSGTVNDVTFGYLFGATSNVQSQINAVNASLTNLAGLQYFKPTNRPQIVWSSVNIVNVNATTDNPAYTYMVGFPDVLNPGQFISGLTNSARYYVTAQTSFTMSSNTYGSEQASQWYALYAVASGANFNILGMPFLRAKSEGSQVISTGTLLVPNNVISYGFTVDQFVNGQIYVLSGTKQGEIRTITANNVAAGATTVTYSGTALNLAQGDWFIVLPHGVNFRWIGDVYNNAGSDIVRFKQDGNTIAWVDDSTYTSVTGPGLTAVEAIIGSPPLAATITIRSPSLAGAGPSETSGFSNTIYVGPSPTFPMAFCKYWVYFSGNDNLHFVDYRYPTAAP